MSFSNSVRIALAAAFALLVTAIIGACSSSVHVDGQQQIRHVFIITLENENYATTFGSATKAPYLAQTLPSEGALVQQYYGRGHR